jgi:two-component system, NarL family, sensor histidine kinase DesK
MPRHRNGYPRPMKIRLLPDIPGIGGLPYAWLAFLGFFIIRFFVAPFGMLEFFLSMLGLLAFLVVYFWSYWIGSGLKLLLPIGIMAVIGIAFSPFNVGAGVFFQYAGFFSSRLGTFGRTAAVTSSLCAIIILLTNTFSLGLNYLVPALLVTIALSVAGYNIFIGEQVSQKLYRSQEDAERLAKIAERERIGRDLHDTVGHTLSVIALKSELARKLIESDPQKAYMEIGEVELVARKALSEVRETVKGYRSLDLAHEIDSVGRAFAAAGIALESTLDSGISSLPPKLETALVMMLREAATNIIRHAHATECQVIVSRDSDVVQLTVSDNGVGAADRKGQGIKGMEERMQALGGDLSISGDSGTHVCGTLPLV